MVLLPEERGMTLTELRQIAAHQQHQIEAQQQLLVAKEQRLKFLKQQESHHHNLSEQHLEANCLITLRDKVDSQELKLRELRVLRGQLEQQKTNNSNLGTELDSIRALFCEKEKELDLAVSKVEELSQQLDDIRKSSKRNFLFSSASELENLRRELTYRTKLSEQQNNYICQQREKITNRQQGIANFDIKINELNKRLQRKRLLNEQFASQIQLTVLSQNSSKCSNLNNMLMKIESRVPEILEPEHTQDDLAANLHGHYKCDFGEFSLTKNDPKYQTLPYNTKFTLNEKQLEDSSSSSTEDESSSSRSEASCDKKGSKAFTSMCNFSPRPFINSSGIQKVILQVNNDDLPLSAQEDTDAVPNGSVCIVKLDKSRECFNDVHTLETTKKAVKPTVPPKPALTMKPKPTYQESSHPPQRKRVVLEQDNVSMALTVLKMKSTNEEKSDFRHPVVKDPSHDPLLPKSRILTYFSKTLLQPEGSSQNQHEKSNSAENLKRKSAFGQLPIKPKPLTIRKNPSIEPPKLKVQSLASSLSYRHKVVDSPLFSSKASNSISTTEADQKCLSLTPKKTSDLEDQTSDTKLLKMVDDHDEAILDKADAIADVSRNDVFQNNENVDIKNSEGNETTSEDADCVSDDTDDSSLCKTKKGNMKSEGSVRVVRRVSFDPLALLLDAALEGELELVKKIANEVVNPSAANDEGITALHNAICAGQFEVVKFLVEFGCDVNAPDSDGWTPLHCAASCNNLPMVKFLVERGACIFSTTLSDQETAAEKCEEDGAGFDSCSEYLFSLQENLGVMNNRAVYAVYDYDVQNADELNFKIGDNLTVLRRSDDEENEWWWCRLHDEEGYVPRNLLGLYPRVNFPSAT